MSSRTIGSQDDFIPQGFSLAGLLITLALVGVLTATGLPIFRSVLDSYSLARSADLARAHLNRARLVAVVRREPVKVGLGPAGDLLLLDPRDSVLATTPFQGDGLLRLDSVRIRPARLRFNPRGQAAPGSLYLYRGRKGVRVVSNFLGRLRRELIRIP